MFSPYTPIPYHNNRNTKYTHASIDLLEYVNDRQHNVENYIFKNFFLDEKERYKLNDFHYPFQYVDHGHH